MPWFYTHNIAFIVNLGKAKSSDVMKIVNHVEKTIKLKYGIIIRKEVVIIGFFNYKKYNEIEN